MKLKYEPVWKRFRKRTNGYFYHGAGHELHCSPSSGGEWRQWRKQFSGCSTGGKLLPSASNAGAKGIQVQFDAQVKSEESIIKIESAQTKKGSSESLNLIVPKEAEAKKPVTGLLKTTVDITPENDALKLDFSLQNIAEQDLSLYFSSSQKFDILITNQNGEKVYRWSHDKGFLTVIVDAKLRKYERLSFSEIWDYKDNEGNRVLPGEYTITVKILAKLKDIGTFDLGELKAAKDIEVKMTMIFATANVK